MRRSSNNRVTHTAGLRGTAVLDNEKPGLQHKTTQVPAALIDTESPRTIIAKHVADTVVPKRRRGHAVCVRAPWSEAGEHCGSETSISVQLADCTPRRVRAVVANDLPHGTDLVVGRDALAGVDVITGSPREQPRLRCKRPE